MSAGLAMEFAAEIAELEAGGRPVLGEVPADVSVADEAGSGSVGGDSGAAPEPARSEEILLLGEAAKRACLRPEVAEALFAGVSRKVIARAVGVSVGVLARHVKSLPMQELLELESRRALRAMAKRDLSGEKYAGIALAVSSMIEKARLLRDEPTEIWRGSGSFGMADANERFRAASLIVGQRVEEVGVRGRLVPADGPGQVEKVFRRDDEDGEDGIAGNNVGLDVVAVREGP